jgi:hypothetical protein
VALYWPLKLSRSVLVTSATMINPRTLFVGWRLRRCNEFLAFLVGLDNLFGAGRVFPPLRHFRRRFSSSAFSRAASVKSGLRQEDQ